MVESTTRTFHLTKPDIGGSKETWGNYLNADLDRVDDELTLHNQAQWCGLYQGHPDHSWITVKWYDGSGNVTNTSNLAAEMFRTAQNTLFYPNNIVNSVGNSTAYFIGNKPGAILPQEYLWRALDLLQPVGMIMLWVGGSDTIPPGWRLCNGDGGATGVPVEGVGAGWMLGIPDLRGRFVMGAYANGDPSGLTAWYQSGQAGVFGHTHASTVLAHALVADEIPALEVRPARTASGPIQGSDSMVVRTSARNDVDFDLPSRTGTSNGDADSKVATTMSGVPKGVTNAAALGHAHSMNNVANVNDPDAPFYALCYIIKWRHWQSWARGQTTAI